MSFNVEGLSAAKEQLIADLRQRLQCAVVCVQETHRGPDALPAQHTRNGFDHRETTLIIWQCHICYVGHHREYNITNRHQQHRYPESRPKWNLSDVSLQTTGGRYYEHSLSSLSAIYLTKWLRRSYVSIMSITKHY